MILIKAINGEIVNFPYSMNDLRLEHPEISFPLNPSPDMLARFDVFIVFYHPYPLFDTRTQRMDISQTPILIDNVWTMTRTVIDKTTEEIAEYDATELHDLKFKLFDDIDYRTNELIVTGWVYGGPGGVNVRLTQEDQHNYEGEYTMIREIIEDGVPESMIFPSVFKVWTEDDGTPQFLQFTSLNEMKGFIYAGKTYIKNCLTVGWTLKNELNTKNIDELRAWVDPR